jgi:CspA family cold shock protein
MARLTASRTMGSFDSFEEWIGRTVRITGRVVRFDAIRGYGFIAPDSGGDDVFLHANDLEFEKALAKPGTKVSFELEDGPRGKFATSVQLSVVDATAHAVDHRDSGLASDEYYDVLSVGQFKGLVTEILLEIRPAITGEQIQQARALFETFARKHGWVE